MQQNILPQPCAICGQRAAQATVGGKDHTGATIQVLTCAECFAEPPPLSEVHLWRRSLKLIIGGWPR